MTPKQRSKIYLKAAENIDVGIDGYCCIAIDEAVENISCNIDYSDIPFLFPELLLFKPKKLPEHGGWFGDDLIPKNQSCRVLALLFCSVMASTELYPPNCT